MFDAYKRFFRFSGAEKGTWYKGMAFELLRSIFEALQFVALLIVLRALVGQNMTGATAWMALGIMAVSVAGAAFCWYLAHNSEGHANYRMCGEKRIHIGERMKYMPMGYFNAQSLGSLTAAATSTMSDLESMSFAVIARTVVGMIRTTIFSLATMCFDWRIGLVFFVGILLFLWVNSRPVSYTHLDVYKRQGKSTACKLAARFWDVTGGKVLLGGTDVSTVDPETLLRSYSMVFQDVVLFRDTVMENIRLGRRGATDEEVLEAARAAQCDELIRKLPQGYQTVIGENGSTLSGGERQRISIARCILKDAPIVILDEATASVDADNESYIQQAISELVQGKTLLVIAHRLNTIRGADQILVISDGEIDQRGTHQSLMEEDGIYRNFVTVRQQSRGWNRKAGA